MSIEPEVLTRSVRVDPATRYVRSLPGNYLMLREAAHACGVSSFVLRKFIAEGTPGCLPSKTATWGKVRIYLYTMKDVARIQKHLAERQTVQDFDGQTKKVGRPPKYGESERKWRDQQHSKKWYWKNRVKLLNDKGDTAGAEQAQKRVDEIEKELKRK